MAGHPDQRHDAAFVVGAILGGAGGAVYGLLHAPQAGARTRGQLAEQIDAVVQALLDAGGGARARADRLAEQAGAAVASVVPNRAEADPALGRSLADTEPIFTLPDPLEPDPLVAAGPAGDAGPIDDVPVVLTGPRTLPADLDVVLDGPRPADADPAP